MITMGKLIDRLSEVLGVVNAHHFARRGGAVAWISYSVWHPDAQGRHDYRAIVHYVAGGQWRKRAFRERPDSGKPADIRRACVEAAQKAASARFGVTEWVAGPFPNTWMPQDVRQRVMAALNAAEKERVTL